MVQLKIQREACIGFERVAGQSINKLPSDLVMSLGLVEPEHHGELMT